MNNKCLKLLISICVIVCVVFSSAVMCFAEPDPNAPQRPPSVEPGGPENPDNQNPDNQSPIVMPDVPAEEEEGEKEEEKEEEEEGSGSSSGSQDTTQTTTQGRPDTSTGTTRRPSNQQANNNNNNNNVQRSTTTTKPATTLQELPEGAFYVFLELNNGEQRRKTIMEKEGVVPIPNIPKREGYLFDGWYADAKFTKKWNFEKDIAKGTVVIYAKWIADGNTVTYKISVPEVAGGSIEVNPNTASKGEPVTITVKPDKGMRLIAGSLTINGKPSDVLSFIMPASDVVIGAKFEKIPAEELVEKESVSLVPFIIGGVIIALAIVVIAIVVAKRKANNQVPQFDESGALIIEDDDDGWIDESIVIGDGFENGKIVRESSDIDFNAFESDADNLGDE